MKKILLIEDECAIADAISDALDFHGYAVTLAGSAEEGEDLLGKMNFDLILLDVMLPGRDGFDMLRTIRSKQIDIPVILLTARGEEVDKVAGLEVGADDYVTKPFSNRELVARIKAHLRRTSGKQVPQEFTFGDIRVDYLSHKVFCRDEPVYLTSTEFGILKLLIRQRPDVVSREMILNEIWGYTFCPDSRMVDTHILNLRKKVESDPHNPNFIKTHHGVGYKFVG